MSDRADVLWRRLDVPGHEACRLRARRTGWELSGTSVFRFEARPVRLDYVVEINAAWRTKSASVRGWFGDREIALELRSDRNRRWWCNDQEYPEVAGAFDVDLAFSPSTNTLAIRRLNLTVGGSGDLRAAWLPFPELRPRPLDQRYTRLADRRYRFESSSLSFMAELEVEAHGLVTRYPGLWEREEGT